MTQIPPTGLRGAVDLSSLAQRAAAPSTPGGAAAGAPSTHPAAGPDGTLTVPSLVLDVTDATFPALLELSQTVPIVVDLWAEWCGPCKQLTPVLEKLVAEFGGRVLLAKVDVDANPQLAQAFQAQSIPTVAAVIGGRPVGLFVGALPEAEVRQVFEQVFQLAAQNGVAGRVSVEGEEPGEAPEPVEEPLPPLHQAAYDAIEQGDYPAAITAYETAIKQSPSDRLAVAGLAQVRLLLRLQGVTLAEVRQAAADAPQDLEAQLRVADLDLSGGHLEDAFDRLLTLFPSLDEEGRTSVRARLLEFFEVAGAEDPRVVTARRRLASLLF